jgi:D-alanyl-D-alanine carboxypeptidase (penicillin-binding protein 5/6)
VGRLSRHIAASILIVVAFFALVPGAASAATPSSPPVYAPSATLTTGDGTVLWSKNPGAHRRVASTIKLLNALVVRDQVDLDKVITVSKEAAAIDNGTVGLTRGQKLTVRQLLNIMLVHSANDAAEALAVGIAGSEKKYVALMNAKAKELGLKHTKATDPHGLGKQETCSAEDLAVIAKHVLADPVLRGIVRQTSVKVPRANGTVEVYSTTDQLLGNYRGIEGIKTGYTDPAGYCFVGAAKRNGVELIGVVLGAGGSSERFAQMRKLLDWGFAHTKAQRLVSAETTMGVVEVSGGAVPTVTVHAAKALGMTQFDGAEKLTTQVSLPPSVSAPIVAGQELGAVQVSRAGVLVASVPLVADTPVEKVVSAVSESHAGSATASTSATSGAWPWAQIVNVWAGLGRMLGI